MFMLYIGHHRVQQQNQFDICTASNLELFYFLDFEMMVLQGCISFETWCC